MCNVKTELSKSQSKFHKTVKSLGARMGHYQTLRLSQNLDTARQHLGLGTTGVV